MDRIPLTFDSEAQYFSSFIYPLLEETRAQVASSLEFINILPYAEITNIQKANSDISFMYDVTVGPWRNRSFERGKPPYETFPGDLLIFMDGKAESVSNLQRMGRTWALSLVRKMKDNDNGDDIDNTLMSFKVDASQHIEFQDGMFVVFLLNTTIPKRIWNSLHIDGNLNIIKEILYPGSMVRSLLN